MPAPKVHAVIVNGTDSNDVHGACNFLDTLRSCFSRGIIPCVLSTYGHEDLSDLISTAGDCTPPDSSLEPADPEYPSSSALPLDLPSAKDARDMLETVRPFYTIVPAAEMRHELRKWVRETTAVMRYGDRLLVILCAQGVHKSGSVLLGRTLTSQETWLYMDTLPVKCTAVVAITATGLDDQKEMWEEYRPAKLESLDENRLMGMMRPECGPSIIRGRGRYTAARIEVIKALGPRNVETEMQRIRDSPMRATIGDIFRDYEDLKSTPWSYSELQWKTVDSVAERFEEILSREVAVGGAQTDLTLLGMVVRKLSQARQFFPRGPLDLSVCYLEKKLHDMPNDGASTILGLEGMMKRVVDEAGKTRYKFFNTVNATFLFQRRVEASVRYMERTDVRVEGFKQLCLKAGVFRTLDVRKLFIDPMVKRRVTQKFAVMSRKFHSVIYPPGNTVNFEYYTQAFALVRLIEFHIKWCGWFEWNKYLDFMGAHFYSTTSSPEAPTRIPAPVQRRRMAWFQKTFSLKAQARGSYLVTQEVTAALPEIAEYKIGLLNLFIQHTSCALSLNENWDSDVRLDMTDALNRIVVEDKKYEGIYRHDAEGSDDMPAHVKSSLVGVSVTIPISDGRLNLGTWQGIWYMEFRNSKHQRNIVATIQGEKKSGADE
ncbi:hypothetical protein DRE_00368 [Drechslerella stenobrocha 248]|uniref:Secondary thiamine-phosphate synthase enzyme n=1 Tax=Drechslerella stenobrocha 248 TaxID=1043628 RepID=W7IEF1_9PEZI|nr:hypothetical protein DRE_00368 [Drechslerella stenobrocha 248]